MATCYTCLLLAQHCPSMAKAFPPPFLNAPSAMQLYLNQMCESTAGDSIPDAVQRLLKSKACRSAIMFGDELSLDSCQSLIRQVLRIALACHACETAEA